MLVNHLESSLSLKNCQSSIIKSFTFCLKATSLFIFLKVDFVSNITFDTSFSFMVTNFSFALYSLIINDLNPCDQICPGNRHQFVFAVGIIPSVEIVECHQRRDAKFHCRISHKCIHFKQRYHKI